MSTYKASGPERAIAVRNYRHAMNRVKHSPSESEREAYRIIAIRLDARYNLGRVTI